MAAGAGIDLGSRAIKLAVVDNGVVVRTEVVSSGSRLLDTARVMIDSLPAPCTVTVTGYGREIVDAAYGFPAVTEIKAHAAGARFLDPGCEAVIDIGGQDVKIIALDRQGRVAKFEMNDRCAAGTGRFLEIMANRLGFPLEEFATTSKRGTGKVSINSMCTVFAESEVIGLLGRGNEPEDIGHALHASIARRIAAMAARVVRPATAILATGGGSRNFLLVEMLCGLAGCAISTHELGPFAGAIGCALLSNETNRNEEKAYVPNHC